MNAASLQAEAAPSPAAGASPDSGEAKHPTRRRLTVVLNRESGTIAGLGPEKVAARLVEILEELGCQATVHSVKGAEVEGALKAARDDSSEAIIIGGGDGTVASAATILAGSEKPLGVLPLGTFNLAARDLGMPLDWEEAAKTLVTAPQGCIDLLEVDGHLHICVVVLGFYPSLAMGKPEYHGSWVWKTVTTVWQTLQHAATFPPLDLSLSNGSTEQRFRTRLALIANNDYQDIFGLIPVRQSLDAGHFTVYISKHRTQWGLFRSAVSWILGRWKQDREISTIQATKLQIDVKRKKRVSVMMDGELRKISLPFTVTLKPKALYAIIPGLAEVAGS